MNLTNRDCWILGCTTALIVIIIFAAYSLHREPIFTREDCEGYGGAFYPPNKCARNGTVCEDTGAALHCWAAQGNNLKYALNQTYCAYNCEREART